jgi:hypothetical protein
MGDFAPIPVSVEMYPLFKSKGGIAAASVLARAAGGRASLPRMVLTLPRCDGKVSMLQAAAKGKMLLSPRTHEFAEGSMHVRRVDFGVVSKTEKRRSSRDAASRRFCDSSTRTINLIIF